MLCKEASLGICRQQRPRSAWAFVQSDQDLHYLQTESLDIYRMECKGLDDTFCMFSMICIFAFCSCLKAQIFYFTLKAPSKICSRRHFNVLFFFLFFFIRPFEKQDVLCYGVCRPSVNFFVSG